MLKVRNTILRILELLLPLFVYLLVYIKDCNLFKIINQQFLNNISLSEQLGISLTVLTIIAGVFLKFFNQPCKISIKMDNNYRKNTTIFNSNDIESDRYKIINIFIEIKYIIRLLKKIFKNKFKIFINLEIPNGLVYQIEDMDYYREAIVKKDLNNIVIDLTKLMSENELCHYSNLKLGIKPQTAVEFKKSIEVNLVCESEAFSLDKGMFIEKVLKFIFVSFNTNNHVIEISE